MKKHPTTQISPYVFPRNPQQIAHSTAIPQANSRIGLDRLSDLRQSADMNGSNECRVCSELDDELTACGARPSEAAVNCWRERLDEHFHWQHRPVQDRPVVAGEAWTLTPYQPKPRRRIHVRSIRRRRRIDVWTLPLWRTETIAPCSVRSIELKISFAIRG